MDPAKDLDVPSINVYSNINTYTPGWHGCPLNVPSHPAKFSLNAVCEDL